MSKTHYIGERISYDGALCTVRYVGQVAGASGSWLGVEWDDATRGKHNGSHKGASYFTCVSKSPTAASFVRPTRPADVPQSFVAALKGKYADDSPKKDQSVMGQIVISGKVAEEVGFDKVRKQMARLDELKVVILDGMRISWPYADGEETVADVCPKVAQLDMSRNLFESLEPVVSICSALKGLKKLAIDGNRFQNITNNRSLAGASEAFAGVGELGIGDNQLSWEEICHLSAAFPSLHTLAAGANNLSILPSLDYSHISSALTTLNLEYNDFTALSDLGSLAALSSLRNLHLKGNNITSISSPDATCPTFSSSLQYLDVSYNKVQSWSFVDSVTTTFPGLTAIRISHNPVYDVRVSNAPSATADEAHMFTIARMGQLKTLNFSQISTSDRTNAEMFYLSRIAKQLTTVPESAEHTVLEQHPRYAELCTIYGEPDIIRREEVNPSFLEARLISVALHCAGKENKTVKIPQSFDIYAVKGIVGRLYGLQPRQLRLIWETGEWDPVASKNISHDDSNESDSSDDDEEEITNVDPTLHLDDKQAAEQPGRWVKREVELKDGPRLMGYCVDGQDVSIRVETA